MQNEEKVTFPREGQQQPDVIPGDVIFILRQSPHSTYSRVGNDLYRDMDISLKESILGFKKKIKTVDGREIEVRNEPNEIIKPFSWMIIEGEGMPIRGNTTKKGDLHIKFKVNIPTQLSEKQKEAVRKIFKTNEAEVKE